MTQNYLSGRKYCQNSNEMFFPCDSAPTPLIRPPSGVKALVLLYLMSCHDVTTSRDVTPWQHNVKWCHAMTSQRHATSRHDDTMSCDVTAWRHNVMWRYDRTSQCHVMSHHKVFRQKHWLHPWLRYMHLHSWHPVHFYEPCQKPFHYKSSLYIVRWVLITHNYRTFKADK